MDEKMCPDTTFEVNKHSPKYIICTFIEINVYQYILVSLSYVHVLTFVSINTRVHGKTAEFHKGKTRFPQQFVISTCL